MSQGTHEDNSILELLAGKALGDLSLEEENSLGDLLTEDWHQVADEIEQTAAAIHLVALGSYSTALSPHLRQRILAEIARHVSRQSSSDANDSSSGDVVVLQDRIGSRREAIAWLVTAASLMIAFGVWFSSKWTPQSNLMDKRQRLLSSSETISIQWAAGKTPFEAPVSGDVVWNTRQQEGYMRFVNMPVNDPTREQYQLWIIDPERDEAPIDGGVFDIASTGELIVPIHAKLKVLKPVAFAVTIEKPGGVVVSKQDRLPLLASVP